MHAQVGKSDLKKALAIVLRAVPRKPGEGEGGVLIESWENSISLETCGGDHNLVVHVPAKVADHGEVYVSAREVLESVKGEVGKTVDIRSIGDYAVNTSGDEYQVVKVAGRALRRMNTPLAFLPLPIPSQSLYEAILDAQQLRKALQRTLYAVSPEWDIRGAFRSVYLSFTNYGAVIQTGNEWRRAKATAAIQELQEDFRFNVPLPVQAAENLMRSLVDARDKVVVRSDGEYVSFDCGLFSMVARMSTSDGWYFSPHSKEAPSEFSVTTARADLLAVAKDAAKAQRNDVLPLCLRPEGAILRAFVDEGSDYDLVCRVTGFSHSIALDPQFLAEALGVIDSDAVVLSYYPPHTVRIVADTLYPEPHEHYIATITGQ